MSSIEIQEIRIYGIGASPGICIGKAYLVDKEGVDVVEQYQIDFKKLKPEVKRFKTAVKKAKEKLQKQIEDIPDELRQHSHILEVHKSLLKDKMLYDKAIETIETEQVNAEWALKTTVSAIKAMFQKMPNPYLKERAADITHLSESIMAELSGATTINISEIDKRVILVTKDLSPAETSQIQLERIKGFITDRGGRTTHTGIIARTLEIPAVLGLGHATTVIRNGDLLAVDGSKGTVIIHPTEQTLLEYEERQQKHEQYQADITRQSRHPAETADGVHFRVMGNIELPEEVFSVINYGADGIGLYRTEFQYLSRSGFPNEMELYDKYKDVISVMTPKPVTIRTLDINGDKAPGGSEYNGLNPSLGLRGIRYCLARPDVFKVQLRAILRAAVFGHVRIMFPMVSNPTEVIEAKELIREVMQALAKEGLPYSDQVRIGIMVEVPSAVIMADSIAELVDFFSIGTNDLIQYALAIDRGNRQVAHLFHPLQPAIIRMLHHVITVAKNKGIKVFMCGEMASDPLSMPVLLGLGLDELSMNPQSIPMVKRIIRSIDSKEARKLIKDLLKLTTISDTIALVEKRFAKLLSNHNEISE